VTASLEPDYGLRQYLGRRTSIEEYSALIVSPAKAGAHFPAISLPKHGFALSRE
jgi:hypothetical protein